MPTFTTSDGVELHYREAGSGRSVLIVPGWGCTTRYFDRQLRDLSQSFHVVVYDPRGHGESEKTRRGHRMGRVAHDVRELIVELNLHDVTLVGWSLGCSVVLYYVDLFGADRVTKIGCVGGGPLLINRSGWDKGFVNLAAGDAWRAGLEADFRATASEIVPRFFRRPPAVSEMSMLTKETLKTSPAEGAAAMTWDCINQDMRDLLPHIIQPTLIALGRHDTIVPVENAEVFIDIPDVLIEIFEESGHAPFIEEPARFNDILTDFINKEPKGQSLS